MIERFRLTGDEVAAIKPVLRELMARFDTSEDPQFLLEAPVWAHELPRRVRLAARDFSFHEAAPNIFIVADYPVDQEALGDTPIHWSHRDGRSPALEYEMLLVLLGSLLGEPIGWSTQQDGYIVHDILPIRGHEQEQLGSGSETLLAWHTEDAFHPWRGDYLGMLCLRNPDRVPTTVAWIDGVEIADDHRRVLCQPRFTIRPDESHLPKNKSQERDVSDPLLREAYERIERMNTTPEKIALLTGDPRSPYVRLDPYFMDRLEDDPEAQEALDVLCTAVDAALADLVLEPGDFCFIDNFRVVHGRKPFKARYDGRDRWLKRINVVRDMRKSRPGRAAADSRVIL